MDCVQSFVDAHRDGASDEKSSKDSHEKFDEDSDEKSLMRS